MSSLQQLNLILLMLDQTPLFSTHRFQYAIEGLDGLKWEEAEPGNNGCWQTERTKQKTNVWVVCYATSSLSGKWISGSRAILASWRRITDSWLTVKQAKVETLQNLHEPGPRNSLDTNLEDRPDLGSGGESKHSEASTVFQDSFLTFDLNPSNQKKNHYDKDKRAELHISNSQMEEAGAVPEVYREESSCEWGQKN